MQGYPFSNIFLSISHSINIPLLKHSKIAMTGGSKQPCHDPFNLFFYSCNLNYLYAALFPILNSAWAILLILLIFLPTLN